MVAKKRRPTLREGPQVSNHDIYTHTTDIESLHESRIDSNAPPDCPHEISNSRTRSRSLRDQPGNGRRNRARPVRHPGVALALPFLSQSSTFDAVLLRYSDRRTARRDSRGVYLYPSRLGRFERSRSGPALDTGPVRSDGRRREGDGSSTVIEESNRTPRACIRCLDEKARTERRVQHMVAATATSPNGSRDESSISDRFSIGRPAVTVG
ncbi:hypothetical protein BSL78_10260 [Apostichopus japonicus]|uniref:Uncharacterized protein n=1 Tax=Stichopus japonicus TaxID=307972 RepID=A0A2G8KXT1_STIJA|nr:hypothetical protein BSL78_10260 [Apostichopus japonicus]